jgi:2,3-dihydroxybiphenyl 1,2-dioxygenase
MDSAYDFAYRGLGYVGVAAPDLDAWRDFGTRVCGMMPAPIPPKALAGEPARPDPEAAGIGAGDALFLKLDDYQWRLAVHPSNEPGLRYLGFELGDLSALDRAASVLASRGVSVTAATETEREARGVGAMIWLEDPAGHRLELFAAPLRDRGFNSPQGMEFLTGGLGMGHAVLFVPNVEEALEFYRGTLGFIRSDFTRFAADSSIHFLRCTARHHSLALLQVGPLTGLQHLMFETRTLDDVGRSLDRARERGVQITSELGRHRNDENVSFYMEGPSGFQVEMGWDGMLVGDDWVENEFTGGGDLWGHAGLDVRSAEGVDE